MRTRLQHHFNTPHFGKDDPDFEYRQHHPPQDRRPCPDGGRGGPRVSGNLQRIWLRLCRQRDGKLQGPDLSGNQDRGAALSLGEGAPRRHPAVRRRPADHGGSGKARHEISPRRHRHQHGLPSPQGGGQRRRQRADEKSSACRADCQGGVRGGGGAGHRQVPQGLGRKLGQRGGVCQDHGGERRGGAVHPRASARSRKPSPSR